MYYNGTQRTGCGCRQKTQRTRGHQKGNDHCRQRCCQFECGSTTLEWTDECGNCFRKTIQSDVDPAAFLQTNQQLAAALQLALQQNIGNPAGLSLALIQLGIFDAFSTLTIIGNAVIPTQTLIGPQITAPTGFPAYFNTITTAFPPTGPISVQVIGNPISGDLATYTIVISYSSAAGPVTITITALARINNCGQTFPTILQGLSVLTSPPFP